MEIKPKIILVIVSSDPDEEPFSVKEYTNPNSLCITVIPALYRNNQCGFTDENGNVLSLNSALQYLGVEDPESLINEYRQAHLDNIYFFRQLFYPGRLNVAVGIIILTILVIALIWRESLQHYIIYLQITALALTAFSLFRAVKNNNNAHKMVWGFMAIVLHIWILINILF